MRIKKDVEIYDTLGNSAAAGVQFAYHSCDISDWDALGKTLDAIRCGGRPDRGHHPRRRAMRSRPASSRKRAECWTAPWPGKVDGAVALMALTQRDPLRWFVGFGSSAAALAAMA